MDMCNLSAGIREDGVRKGAELKDLEYLRKFMKKFNISFEQAAEMMELSESDKEKYSKII
jgi:hypothetical protein